MVRDSWPILKMQSVAVPTVRWTAGTTYEFRLWLAGLVPWGQHRVTVVHCDPASGVWTTQESGGALTHWRHDHRVAAKSADHCIYTDEIVFGAGVLTPVLKQYVKLLYSHRHRRLTRHFRALRL